MSSCWGPAADYLWGTWGEGTFSVSVLAPQINICWIKLSSDEISWNTKWPEFSLLWLIGLEINLVKDVSVTFSPFVAQNHSVYLCLCLMYFVYMLYGSWAMHQWLFGFAFKLDSLVYLYVDGSYCSSTELDHTVMHCVLFYIVLFQIDLYPLSYRLKTEFSTDHKWDFPSLKCLVDVCQKKY